MRGESARRAARPGREPPVARVYWQEDRTPENGLCPPLAKDARAEIVVVGGGVAGLSCARALSEAGRQVVLLEKSSCGGGASGRSSGFVTPDSEMELSDLIRLRGESRARRLWEFAVSGVEAIRADIERYAIDCDMQLQDSLFLASSRSGAAIVRREHEARQKLGYESTLYDSRALAAVLGSEECCGGVRYPGTFAVNAFRYCRGMRDALSREGVVIHEHTQVTGVAEGEVRANGHTVRADAIVLCLDRFLPELGVLPAEVYHVQTFLAVSTPLSEAQIAVLFPEARLMVWDTDLVYQYFRMIGGGRLLVGASSVLHTYSSKTEALAPGILHKMRAFLGSKFPSVPVELEYFWPGFIGVSKDFLPLAARLAERSSLHVVSGATGLPWAAALGKYVAEKILSNRSDLDDDFDPERRFPIGRSMQSIVGKPSAFALSHGIVKYLR
jgi:gamma-glutamylputrescine oxidase